MKKNLSVSLFITFLFLIGGFIKAQTTVNFSQENAVQNWTVPAGVTTVTMTVYGAQGGGAISSGGYGTYMIASCTVTPGHNISMAIGAMGSSEPNGQGGGGGGTFVYDSNTVTLLIVCAGGGGGANNGYGPGGAAGTDIITNAAVPGNGTDGSASGGTGGHGGSAGTGGVYPGSAGAGWLSNGANGVSCTGGKYRGNSFAGGSGYGGYGNGGYGGGGGSGIDGSGGGGGYNGGGGGNDDNIGNGGSGGGGGAYLINSATVIYSPIAAGSGNGKVSIAYITTLAVSMASQTNVTCHGGTDGSATANASGGILPYTYSWAPSGGTNVTASGLSAGTYTITVTDHNGNISSTTVTITQPNQLTDSISEELLCNGVNNGSATVIAAGGTAPYTYSWSPIGGTSATGTGFTAGTYTVTVTDACGGDMATATATVTPPTTLTVVMGAPAEVLCFGGNSGSATVSPSGGSMPFTYSWTPAGGTSATGTGLSAGTYTVTVEDACGNSATANVAVTQPPTAISVTRDSTEDNGSNTGSATVSASGGTAPYTYLWTPGGKTTASITGLSAGSYCCTITDNNNCTKTVCITVKSSEGIENIESDTGQITVYPNPSNGIFTIALSHPAAISGAEAIVEIYNVMGQRIYNATLKQVQGDNAVNLSNQPDGVYLYRVITEDGSLIGQGKLIIQK